MYIAYDNSMLMEFDFKINNINNAQQFTMTMSLLSVTAYDNARLLTLRERTLRINNNFDNIKRLAFKLKHNDNNILYCLTIKRLKNRRYQSRKYLSNKLN